jgi:hypothetical protein
MHKRLLACALLASGLLGACKKQYRIGEYVLVEGDEGRLYSAYITERAGKTRFRVHFENYDCDQDVSLERVRGRIEGPPPAPPQKPPCGPVAPPKNPAEPAQPIAAFKTGDRVRVMWRGSVYTATVTSVVAKDRFIVHYEGYESVWDETVGMDRIVGRRQ